MVLFPQNRSHGIGAYHDQREWSYEHRIARDDHRHAHFRGGMVQDGGYCTPISRLYRTGFYKADDGEPMMASGKYAPASTGRRAVVAGATAMLTASVLPSRPAQAALRCVTVDGYGTQLCECGIDNRIRSVVANQQNSQWCWAASVSAIFAFHGFDVSQRRIVEATYGQVVNLPAHGPTIAAASSRDWATDDGRRFTAYCDVLWDSQFHVGRPTAVADAANELAQDQPLIIGTGGHAMVLTAMTYLRDTNGGGQPRAAVVRDPWPGAGRRQLSAQEWYGTSFLARIRAVPR